MPAGIPVPFMLHSSPYLAAACQQVLLDNGHPPTAFSVICTPSPSLLKLGPTAGPAAGPTADTTAGPTSGPTAGPTAGPTVSMYTPSPSLPKPGPTASAHVPNVCNCLIADLVDDGVLSGGLIPAVANALEELLIKEEPVLVPRRLTVKAQAVGVRPSVVEVEVPGMWGSSNGGSSGGGSSGSSGSDGGREDVRGEVCRLDLTAMDAYR